MAGGRSGGALTRLDGGERWVGTLSNHAIARGFVRRIETGGDRGRLSGVRHAHEIGAVRGGEGDVVGPRVR